MGNHQSSEGGSSSKSGTPSHSNSRSRSATDPPQSASTIVDGGYLEPQSHIYATSALEYSRPVVHKLICERRLAPFYLGLNDFESEWDVDDIVTALEEAELQARQNLKDALVAAAEAATEAEANHLTMPPATRKSKEGAAAIAIAVLHRERLAEVLRSRERRQPLSTSPMTTKIETAKLYYRTAVECPICFLYYPPRLVHTRCCDQPMCTECFVQIKRIEPTATHLESEPAACPFCMETNFGVLYLRPEVTRPSMQAIASTSSALSSTSENNTNKSNSNNNININYELPPPKPKPRRKSFAHTEKDVVTTDQVHPDWEAKLEAVKATVARRANRRIVFRQVGERLIPVGITSGRQGDGANATMSNMSLPPGFVAQIASALDPDRNASSGGSNDNSTNSGRRSSRRRNQEMSQYLESIGVNGGQDLEEMMVLEAIRLSILEDEARQQKDKDAKDKADKAAAGVSGETEGTLTPVAEPATSKGQEHPQAETSAQGARRSPPIEVTTAPPGTPRTTASLISNAMNSPIGLAETSSRNFLGSSPYSDDKNDSEASSSGLGPVQAASAGQQRYRSGTIATTGTASTTFSDDSEVVLSPNAGYHTLGDGDDDDNNSSRINVNNDNTQNDHDVAGISENLRNAQLNSNSNHAGNFHNSTNSNPTLSIPTRTSSRNLIDL